MLGKTFLPATEATNPNQQGGYEVGLQSVKEALGRLQCTGYWDVNYWEDTLRWLINTCNYGPVENIFIQKSQGIIEELYGLAREEDRPAIIKAFSRLLLHKLDVRSLELALRILERVADGSKNFYGQRNGVSSQLGNFVDFIIASEALKNFPVDCSASLLRIVAKLNNVDILFELTLVILNRKGETPGKLLWTVADVLLASIAFLDDMTHAWITICYQMGNLLLETSSLKAKWHVANFCRAISERKDCPIDLRDYLGQSLKACHDWASRVEIYADIPEELFNRYLQGLLEATRDAAISATPTKHSMRDISRKSTNTDS